MSTVTKPRAPTVRTRLREAKRFSWTGFGVTVAASLLGALVPAAIGAGPNATLISTLLVTVLAAGGFTAKDASAARGIKAIAIVLLAAGALTLTVTGVTVLDLARGRPATFPVVPDAGDAAPRVLVPASVTCGTTPVGTTTTCTVAVRSVGASALRVTGAELDDAEFAVDASACVGRDVVPGRRCTLVVRFTPLGVGDRVADLTVRHNVPGPAAFVELTGRGG
ncbi:hypothetical protein M8542_01485 [Amycolatopsis sp. OK19-0408]|uniref:HYDIN/VesB/CFA65-like Ig-like domain-containing protein n=1 Tax=Amycolatopsis iheyensis TaxID=2945988 RepID=A0A9X2SIQ1_9PSEU|nr:hypothetical protein [Amycolatopsis iheyensis]MCR6481480.1 hypothetical protein [Amycolatopsis iheyensis]